MITISLFDCIFQTIQISDKNLILMISFHMVYDWNKLNKLKPIKDVNNMYIKLLPTDQVFQFINERLPIVLNNIRNDIENIMEKKITLEY